MRSFFRPAHFVTTCLGTFLFPASKSFRGFSSAAFIRYPALPLPQKPTTSSFLVRAEEDNSCFSNSHTNSRHLQQQQQQQRRDFAMSSDELAKAQNAGAEEVTTIFDKIVKGEIPCEEVYSDDLVLAFRDINPQAEVHLVVIPKNKDGLTQLSKARPDQKELLGHLLYVAQDLGAKECPNGFRVVINDGKDGAQSVYHIHLHVIGGRPMKWPPG